MQWRTSVTSRLSYLPLAVLMVLSAMAISFASEPSPAGRRGIATKVAGDSSVVGSVSKVDNTPVDGAQVQLRNVVTGKIDAKAIADHAGRFTFPHIQGGTYAVELVGENGKILTVGHTFVIGPGETVATFVRLGVKPPFLPGFFSNAASVVTTAAASQGITAIAPVQIPASSGNPPKQ